MATGMIERPAEFRTVRDFLHSAGQHPALLVIEGEAGIGKTTLWLAGVEKARESGFRVLSARSGPAEMVLAYAAVADLLGDVDPAVLTGLPEVQRIALDRVLLRASDEGPSTDQGVVAAAFAAVVGQVAADAPVLVAIDDVQWLDPSSQAVVAFAARRFKGRVGLLVTERTDPDGVNASNLLQLARPDAMARARIGPLSLGGLHALVSARLARSFSRPTMVRIAEISGGNPFFALELARAIEAGPNNTRPALPSTLAELMRIRIGPLDRDTHGVLLAAAAVGDATVELLADVANTTADEIVTRLDEAADKGIVAIEGNRVRFTHPLLSRSVYTDASPAQRRAIHRSLAEVEVLPELKGPAHGAGLLERKPGDVEGARCCGRQRPRSRRACRRGRIHRARNLTRRGQAVAPRARCRAPLQCR